jgi:RNA polymerase sigma factor (sigma-70 family)
MTPTLHWDKTDWTGWTDDDLARLYRLERRTAARAELDRRFAAQRRGIVVALLKFKRLPLVHLDDALQIAAAATHEALHAYPVNGTAAADGDHLRRLVMRVVKCRVFDFCRGLKRKQQHLDGLFTATAAFPNGAMVRPGRLPIGLSHAHSATDPACQVALQEARQRLDEAIARLPEHERRLLDQYLAGRSLAQIAAESGEKDWTVRSRFQRLLNKLAPYLRDLAP